MHVFWNIVFQVLKVLLTEEYKIQLAYQFLHFLFFTSHQNLHQLISFLQLFETNPTFTEKDFCHEFSFFNRFTWTKLMIPKFGEFLVLYRFWFYNFTTQMTFYVTSSYPCPRIKYLSVKIIKYILKCWERSVKRKSNISFIKISFRVTKN